MAFPVPRKRIADSEWGEWSRVSKAPRISWKLPLDCSQAEKNDLEQVLELITIRLHRDSDQIFQTVQPILDRKISPTEMMAELAALEYLLRKNPIDKDCVLYQEKLKDLITNFLQERKRAYLDSGDQRQKTPSGRTHYLLNLFCELLIIEERGISRAGIALVRALLGPSSASCYLEHEHRDHILRILDHLRSDSSFFSRPLNLHPALMKCCKIDRKMTETSPLSALDVKRWAMQMLLTDILQFKGQSNCYAVGSLKFGTANHLGLLLQKLHDILETGVYKIGNKSIDLAVVMELFLIRNKELEVPIPLSGIPVFQDLISLGFKIKEASSIRDAVDEPYLQAVICSYHRNLLQQIVMICMRLPGFNGAYERRCEWDISIERMIELALPHRSKDEIMDILSKSIWGLDCELDCVAHVGDKVFIAGHEVPFSGSLEGLKTVLNKPCLLLIVDAGNKTHIIFTIEQLLHHLNRLIRETLAFNYDVWPLNVGAAFKEWIAELHALPDQDFGNLYIFKADGGVARHVMEYWGFPYQSVDYFQGVKDYFHTVAEKVRPLALPPLSCILLSRGRHNFTATSQQISAKKIDNVSRKRLRRDSRRLAGGKSQAILSQEDVTEILSDILSNLQIDYRDDQLSRIKSELSVSSPSLPEIWARRLRAILIKYCLAVPNPAHIERILRKELGLPQVHYIGDLNWVDGKRKHTKLRIDEDAELMIVRQSGGSQEWIFHEPKSDWFIIPRNLRA